MNHPIETISYLEDFPCTYVFSQSTRKMLTTPDISNDVSPQERAAIEEMIKEESLSRPIDCASAIDKICPIPIPMNERNQPCPAILADIEKYELNPEGPILPGGIDMNRYSSFDDADTTGSESYNALRATLEYAELYERNLEIYLQNTESIAANQERRLDMLLSMESQYTGAISRKRTTTDAINSDRKRQQLDEYLPKISHLHQKWNEGIRALVDLGIETNRRELEMKK